MADAALANRVAAFLYREALLLDSQAWHEWVALFAEDAVFWVPSWAGANETVDNPETELNLIYFTSRVGLEDRVFRIETGDSAASLPLPRTAHIVSNVIAVTLVSGEIFATSSWLVYAVGRHGKQIFGGRYEHTLRPADGAFKIARKKIVLLDEVIEGHLDVYLL